MTMATHLLDERGDDLLRNTVRVRVRGVDGVHTSPGNLDTKSIPQTIRITILTAVP